MVKKWERGGGIEVGGGGRSKGFSNFFPNIKNSTKYEILFCKIVIKLEGGGNYLTEKKHIVRCGM